MCKLWPQIRTRAGAGKILGSGCGAIHVKNAGIPKV